MAGSHTAYIALGANLGNRRVNIAAAVDALRNTPGVSIVKQSSILENPAIGGPPDSPAFLNGVLEIQVTLTAQELLTRLLEIERSLGRERTSRWSPRVIDLDLILYGNDVIDARHLKVPHPLMHQRRFVLEPLAEIAPDVVHPILNRSARDLLIDISPVK